MARSRALIVGAGIGGLSAAIALRRAGLGVALFERAPALVEVGAGISLWANALHALDRLGVGDSVRALSEPYDVAGLRSWDGTMLATISSDDLKRQLGIPAIVLHRAELLAALRSAVEDTDLRLGKTLVALEQHPDSVIARFSDGTEAAGDLLIGADGLHSVVRASLWGDHPTRYAGCTAWRAVVPFTGTQVRASESWGRGSVFGQVPMSGARVYWYATRNVEAGQRHADEKSYLLEMLRGWHSPIEALVEATDASTILRNDIYDRPPIAKWGVGRVTLLGDAAHPMTPYLGQGGCQALEDAVVLGQCLSATADVQSALGSYEFNRIPRTRMFVTRSWRAGRVAQLENPVAISLRNAVVRRLPSHFQSRQVARMINYRV